MKARFTTSARRASADASLAVDTTILGGAPVVALLSVPLTVRTGRALIHFSISGRGNAAGAGWRTLTFQLLMDGVPIAGSAVSSYNQAITLVVPSGGVAHRQTGIAPGPHVFSVNAQIVEAAPNGFEIFAATRPLADRCVLIAEELDP